MEGQRVLKHVTTKIARREVLGYSQLELQESAYDNAFLLPMISLRFFGRSLFLLMVNFFLQYSVAYLLYLRMNATQRMFRERLFGLSGDLPGACWYPDSRRPDDIMCTPDEIFLATEFDRLDLNGDNVWTFAEAAELDQQHFEQSKTRNGPTATATGRQVNIAQVYKNMLHEVLQYAGSRVLPCDTHDVVEAFHPTGYWYDARIENITSDGHVVVRFLRDQSIGYLQNSKTRRLIAGTIYTCSIPKCVDMDNGATDDEYGTCADYNSFADACTGFHDDNDFHAASLCCLCGGGSRSPLLTGYTHIPVGLPVEDISNLQSFVNCRQAAVLPAQQDDCIIRFTSISRDVFQAELAPFIKLCMLPEVEICSNMKLRGLLPEQSFNISSVNVSATVPVFFKMAGISMQADLSADNVCQKAVQVVCPRIFTLQTSLFKDERTDVCGAKSREIKGSAIEVSYVASIAYGDETFGLASALFQGFLFLIVFLWGLASVAEFRSILVWWNVLLALPSCSSEDCLEEKWENGDEISLVISGVSAKFRFLTLLLNLLPRTMLQCGIFIVGVQYLLSVRSIQDLILNSLALTFLVTVDEMLFAAFAGEQNAAWIQETKPIKGRSFKCVDWVLAATHIPLGMFMFFPILIWLSYFLINNKIDTDKLAAATYCLCDLKGQHCFAPNNLA